MRGVNRITFAIFSHLMGVKREFKRYEVLRGVAFSSEVVAFTNQGRH